MSSRLCSAIATAVLVGGLLSPVQVFGAPPSGQGGDSAVADAAGQEPDADESVCSDVPPPGYARCHSRKRTDKKVKNLAPAHVASPKTGTVGNSGAYDPAFL